MIELVLTMGTEDAVVTDFGIATRKHMLKETA